MFVVITVVIGHGFQLAVGVELPGQTALEGYNADREIVQYLGLESLGSSGLVESDVDAISNIHYRIGMGLLSSVVLAFSRSNSSWIVSTWGQHSRTTTTVGTTYRSFSHFVACRKSDRLWPFESLNHISVMYLERLPHSTYST